MAHTSKSRLSLLAAALLCSGCALILLQPDRAARATSPADLTQHLHSGWALRGLAQALSGQGPSAAALAQRTALDKNWSVADARLRASR